MGRAAVKKQKKRKSQTHRRKGAVQPLPLDVSRSRRPNTSKTSGSFRDLKSLRRRFPAQSFSPARLSVITLAWRRLTRMSPSQRADLGMLALPVLLIGLTIAVARWTDGANAPGHLATPAIGAKHALFGLPSAPLPVSLVGPDLLRSARAVPVEPASLHVPAQPAGTATTVPALEPVLPSPRQPEQADPLEPSQSLAEARPDDARAHHDGPVPAAQSLALPPAKQTLASIESGLPATLASPVIEMAQPTPPAIEAAALEMPGGPDALEAGLTQCLLNAKPAQSQIPVNWTPGNPESFGLALAAAARRQLEEFIIYNDRYTRMKYPMGDVHPMYGVCTDVIIRAYRVLGIDLQELVQTTRTGSGDPNIDHRRVDTLRKLFSRFGESLPISTFAEDYRPGDIVTYWRPQNRHSRTHIAIISDLTAPSGRPLIIHNRGWGPQQEDALFVDEITGHYRFSGLKAPEAEHRNSKSAPAKRAGASEQTSPLHNVAKANVKSR